MYQCVVRGAYVRGIIDDYNYIVVYKFYDPMAIDVSW